MAWLQVSRDGFESVCDNKPHRDEECGSWLCACYIVLPEGSIEKLIGRKLTWDDDPVEFE